MMQDRPNTARAGSEGFPAVVAAQSGLSIPIVPPPQGLSIDLTDHTKQRELANALHRLRETRSSGGEPYTEYLKALHHHDLTELQLKKIVFIPELQIEVVRALSHSTESGRAEALLRRIAQLEGAIHHDALVVLADLGSVGYRSVRSCITTLCRLSSAPKELFIGQLGSRFLAIAGDRRELRVLHDPSDIIKSCADFMERRLSFVMNAGEAIPQDLRAQAFAETVTFLACDLARGRGLRFGEALRILEKHDLITVVDEEIMRCATSISGRCRKLLLLFRPPCVRVKSLLPSIDKNSLTQGFREAFLVNVSQRPK